MSEQTLITADSMRIIQEVRSFLETVTEVEITNETEKGNVIALGNELQKKFNEIEKARKAEKGIWDKKAAAVQAEFKPVIDLIAGKKTILGNAITAYNHMLEEKRRQRQLHLDEAARKEREKLEAFAGRREERLKMYQAKVEDVKKQMEEARQDFVLYNSLVGQLQYYQSKVNEFQVKVSDTQQQAAQVTAPIYKPEAPTVSKGTRKQMEASYKILDMKAFVQECLDRDELYLLFIDDAKLKQLIKSTEGKLVRKGMECSWTEKYGFSGR